MAMLGPFKSGGPYAAVALTTSLTSVPTAAVIAGDGETVRVVNACSVPVVVAFDVVAPTASAASPYIVPAGGALSIEVTRGLALFAAAMPIGAASASVYFMRGNGIG
jgi:hypothetical protein